MPTKRIRQLQQMDDQRKKAFDFASDLAKQLITLATAIITVTIAFSKDIISLATIPKYCITIIGLAWFFYLLSIFGGIWTLMALAGELEPHDAARRTPTTTGRNSLIPTIVQISAFLLGTLLIIIYGVVSLSYK